MGEGGVEDGLGEGAVDDDGVREAGGEGLEVVEGEAIEGPEGGGAGREEVVGEVAVEEDLCARGEEAEERDRGGELVDEDVVAGGELGGARERGGEVELAQDRAEDREAAEQARREDGIPGDADPEGPWRVSAWHLGIS